MTQAEWPDTGRQCRCGNGHLTGREIQVLLLAAAGLRNSQIAGELMVSIRTIEQHFITMTRRASARNRVELVARCYASGILRQDAWPPAWSGSHCLRAEDVI
jgi:DNA-binding NarL/FixJ family response regulator